MRAALRLKVWERDRGICAECGVDCALVSRVRFRLAALEGAPAATLIVRRYPPGPAELFFVKAVGWVKRSSCYWEADHVLDLWAGGADRLENAQTLCQPCHAEKTTTRATARAKTKRIRGGGSRRPKKRWPKRSWPKGRKLRGG